MRIVVLSLILLALLLPGLRAEAGTPPRATLRPTAARATAHGEVGYAARGGQLTLQIAVGGLRPVGGGAAYVVWLADGERRLLNAGALVPDADGAASATLGPFALAGGGLIVAVSAEPDAGVAAPTAPQSGIVLSGQFPPAATSPWHNLNALLGPDWYAPILPAALGLTLLRQAGRARRAARP